MIEGDSGEFFGCVRKSTDEPEGYGVFKGSNFVHCGKFKDGCLDFDKSVIASVEQESLILMTWKKEQKQNKSYKLEQYIFGEKAGYFYDGQTKTEILQRLNFKRDLGDWFSMSINLGSGFDPEQSYFFGEHNE